MSELRLVLDSTFDAVPAAGESIRALCLREGLSEADAGLVELGVVEATNNAIRHACGGRPGSRIEVCAAAGPDRLTVQILDPGPEADPQTFEVHDTPPFDPDDLDALPVGGFGLGIIHKVFDHVHFDRCDDRNRLTLVKHRTR